MEGGGGEEREEEGSNKGGKGEEGKGRAGGGERRQQKPHILNTLDVRLVVWRWMMVNVFLFNVSVRELDPEPETERKWHRSNSP